MNRKTIYLAGPMTGRPGDNYPAFNEAAASLRKAGYIVQNPAQNFAGELGLPKEHYLRAAVMLLLQCDGIALMKGWRTSEGAVMEAHIALRLGLFAIDAHDGRPLNIGIEAWANAYEPRQKLNPMRPLTRLIRDVAPLCDTGFTAEDVRMWWNAGGHYVASYKDIGPYISAALANAGCYHRNERENASRTTAKGRGLLRWYHPLAPAPAVA
jgi:hypothetical protein